MVGGRDVLQPLDIGRPGDIGGILRPGDREAQVGPGPRRRDQQPLQGGLAIGAVGAEVGQVPPARRRRWTIGLGVHRAVQGPSRRRSVPLLDEPEGRSAGEREIDVVARDQLGREILEVAPGELGEGDRGVDVVEADRPGRRGLDEPPDRHPVRHVGADDHRIGRGDERTPALQPSQVLVEGEPAEVRLAQVPVLTGVPGHVPLQEDDLVAPGGEGLQEGAIGSGVAVAPGGREAEPQDDEFHARLRSRLCAAWARNRASTSAPRRE